jgi:hypothetical protein
MAQVDFNQENIDAKIVEIKGMSPSDRAPLLEAMRTDFKGFLFDTFSFSSAYTTCIDNGDDTIYQEWGSGCALALDNENWTLVVEWPGEPGSDVAACKKTKQVVTGGGTYNSNTGKWEYEIEKRVSWTIDK